MNSNIGKFNAVKCSSAEAKEVLVDNSNYLTRPLKDNRRYLQEVFGDDDINNKKPSDKGTVNVFDEKYTNKLMEIKYAIKKAKNNMDPGNIPKSRKSAETKNLPLHVRIEERKGLRFYAIRKHPLCECKLFGPKMGCQNLEQSKKKCIAYVALLNLIYGFKMKIYIYNARIKLNELYTESRDFLLAKLKEAVLELRQIKNDVSEFNY